VLKDRNKDGLLEYAQKFWSEPGKRDGLYWDTKEGEQPSLSAPSLLPPSSVDMRRVLPAVSQIPITAIITVCSRHRAMMHPAVPMTMLSKAR